MAGLRHILILHLEDDSFDAELIARELKRLPFQTTIIRVAEETEFERLLHEKKFDVIVCDSGLPGYESLDALEAAKAAQPATPFVFLSGNDSAKLRMRGIAAGADDFLNKNDLDALRLKISELLG